MAGGTDDPLLRPRERETLDAALEYLARARSALHLETRRRTDRLVLDHQPAIALAMGFEDEPRLLAIDGLMRALFEHARQVAFTLRTVTARVLEQGSSFAEVPTSLGGALGALADAAEADREPAPALLDAIEDVASQAGDVRTDEERAAILRLLHAGDRGSWRSRSSTGSTCSPGFSRPGPTFAVVRSATPTTGTRSMRT